MRAAWGDIRFEAFVCLYSRAILVIFSAPAALEAFEIHLQDVGFASLLCMWLGKLLLDTCSPKGKDKDKGEGKL